MKRAVFIVIDGMDGSGKSEMVKRLHNYLFSKDKRYRILTTREPTAGSYGKKIREMLTEDRNPEDNSGKMFDLFIQDREEHLNGVVNPFLDTLTGNNVNIVICDRYYHSTIAFQSTQGININTIIDKNKLFLKPDLTIILDLAPEIALKRMHARSKEKFEKLAFMKELRKQFLELPELLDENICIIDASQSKESVFKAIQKEVDKLLLRCS